MFWLCIALHIFPLLCARAPYIGSAHGEGAGPREVSAARDEKLVPDIYRTIPGSSDAPRPEEYDPSLKRDD